MKQRSPRLVLISLVGVFALPLVLAVFLFQGQLPGVSGATQNRGRLVEPPVGMDWAAVLVREPAVGASDLAGHWVVLFVLPDACGDPCRTRVTALRQVHLASGRNRDRVRIGLYSAAPIAPAARQALLNTYPEFVLLESASGSLENAISQARFRSDLASDCFLVDPLGQIMMAYNPAQDPSDLNRDLKHLLTWSRLDKGP